MRLNKPVCFDWGEAPWSVASHRTLKITSNPICSPQCLQQHPPGQSPLIREESFSCDRHTPEVREPWLWLWSVPNMRHQEVRTLLWCLLSCLPAVTDVQTVLYHFCRHIFSDFTLLLMYYSFFSCIPVIIYPCLNCVAFVTLILLITWLFLP